MLDYILHTGVAHDQNPPGRGSGRFGWGTGENPGQHQRGFLTEVSRLREKGYTNAEIAKMLLGENATTTTLKAEIAIARTAERQMNIQRVQKVLEECNGNKSEAARRLGMNESSIRSLLDPIAADNTLKYQNTADMLKKAINEKGLIDVSKYQELYMGCTDNTKKVAIEMLVKEGYVKTWVKIPQVGTDHETTVMVLAPPGTTYKYIQEHKFEVQSVTDFSPDEGRTWWTPEFPASLDSSRVYIRYKEDGGVEKDGVIELRKGVEDISLGGSNYAQVRIAVDGTHYMKGMAIYSDDIPEGYDVVYNTNKKIGTPMLGNSDNTVLKNLKINPETGEVDQDNPFGALIKSPKDKDGIITAGGQRHYIDENGVEQLSPINKLRDEGDWDSWSRTLSSQFLAKQPIKLINQQIDLSVTQKQMELDEIMALTNPVVKKRLLEDFAGKCDSNAVDLSTASVKNQAFQVLLPVTSLKDNEIYAPNYETGDTVALVRYPHGGIFEIPVLTVNNNQADAKSILGNALDAVGINQKTADQLSGADFDGDTAIVIPLKSNKLKISSTGYLEQLKDFDPKIYKLDDDEPYVKNRTKQIQMGIVTNLIADMTVEGADLDEIARAVKHSMVVIDSEKHHLDYKQSAIDNDIASLKEEYQGSKNAGASTIITKAKSTVDVPDRTEITRTSEMTEAELKRWESGLKVYRETGKTVVKNITDTSKMTDEELATYNSGKKVWRDTGELKTVKVAAMDTVDDAMDLVKDTSNLKEVAYANYANSLKGLAATARKEARSIKSTPMDPTAKKTYAKEVEELDAALRLATSNNPKERRAQAIANTIYSEKLKSNPSMDSEHKSREASLALTKARSIVGAKKTKISITDKQWEAIQANAISTSKLASIIGNCDIDKVKKLATPKTSTKSALSNGQIAFAKSMANSGMYTQREIADRLGVSLSTIQRALKS